MIISSDLKILMKKIKYNIIMLISLLIKQKLKMYINQLNKRHKISNKNNYPKSKKFNSTLNNILKTIYKLVMF